MPAFGNGLQNNNMSFQPTPLYIADPKAGETGRIWRARQRHFMGVWG